MRLEVEEEEEEEDDDDDDGTLLMLMRELSASVVNIGGLGCHTMELFGLVCRPSRFAAGPDEGRCDRCAF